MWISPALVSRDPASARSRSSAAGRSPCSASTGTHSSALVLTLLTFCPPGPPERAYWRRSVPGGANTPGASSSPGGVCGGEGSSISGSTVLRGCVILTDRGHGYCWRGRGQHALEPHVVRRAREEDRDQQQ